MPTQQRMERQIERTRDLQSVVGTMKALAAVSIRQYERAAVSLDEYRRTLELGLQVVLPHVHGWGPSRRIEGGRRVAVVLGSDQGMCGRFNEEIVERVERSLRGREEAASWRLLVAGERAGTLLEASGWSLGRLFQVPGSEAGITPLVQELLSLLGATENLAEVLVYYNRYVSGAAYEPTELRLLPLDRDWLERLRSAPWPTRQLPRSMMECEQLFLFLVRELLFVSLHRAVAHSLAGENASRLASMQAAESNIEERLAELTTAYYQARQSEITEELLDIVSGFEVLSTE